MRGFVPATMRDSMAVRELARAADIVENVRRKMSSSNTASKKGCEQVGKKLNGIIVEMLKEERDGD